MLANFKPNYFSYTSLSFVANPRRHLLRQPNGYKNGLKLGDDAEAMGNGRFIPWTSASRISSCLVFANDLHLLHCGLNTGMQLSIGATLADTFFDNITTFIHTKSIEKRTVISDASGHLILSIRVSDMFSDTARNA